MTANQPPAAADEPAWWLQYRKAVVAFVVALVAALIVLAAQLAAGGAMTPEKWITVVVAFLNALLTPVGVATVSNAHSRADLEARLAAITTGPAR